MGGYLSKSDFKVARECPAKLYYKKEGYPSRKREDRYLEYLADGGYMVEAIAHCLYPDGVELAFGLGQTEEAAEATRRWVEETGRGVLFEAVVVWRSFIARIDILQKEAGVLRLVEVKSASVDTSEGDPLRGARGGIMSDRRPYVEDVTYQAALLERAFPGFTVEPYLCMVDKAKPVGELRDEVWSAAERFASSIGPAGVSRLPGKLAPSCGKCEYRYHDVADYPREGVRDGFAECWREPAAEPHHLVDLYYASELGGRGSGTVQGLIERGIADLRKIDPSVCTGRRGERQAIQIRWSAEDRELIHPALADLLSSHAYPLSFIDFEATRPAIPFYPGMRPYELVCFQWSVHTIRKPGGPLEHAEWIGAGREFPNFEFAERLRDAIGEEGTIYTWSPFESTCFRTIASQIQVYEPERSDLSGWLAGLDPTASTRVIDLCRLALEYCFHPLMKGSTSVKYVLPAVLRAEPGILDRPEFRKYRRPADDGTPANPYDTLPAIALADGTELDPVREGTGAIRAYEELLFGASAGDPVARAALGKTLLQYCELDTAAMVMVWERWRMGASVS